MGLHLSRGAAFHIHQNVIGTVLDRTRTNGQPTVNRQSTDSQGSRHSRIKPKSGLFLTPLIQYIYYVYILFLLSLFLFAHVIFFSYLCTRKGFERIITTNI